VVQLVVLVFQVPEARLEQEAQLALLVQLALVALPVLLEQLVK